MPSSSTNVFRSLSQVFAVYVENVHALDPDCLSHHFFFQLSVSRGPWDAEGGAKEERTVLYESELAPPSLRPSFAGVSIDRAAAATCVECIPARGSASEDHGIPSCHVADQPRHCIFSLFSVSSKSSGTQPSVLPPSAAFSAADPISGPRCRQCAEDVGSILRLFQQQKQKQLQESRVVALGNREDGMSASPSPSDQSTAVDGDVLVEDSLNAETETGLEICCIYERHFVPWIGCDLIPVLTGKSAIAVSSALPSSSSPSSSSSSFSPPFATPATSATIAATVAENVAGDGDHAPAENPVAANPFCNKEQPQQRSDDGSFACIFHLSDDSLLKFSPSSTLMPLPAVDATPCDIRRYRGVVAAALELGKLRKHAVDAQMAQTRRHAALLETQHRARMLRHFLVTRRRDLEQRRARLEERQQRLARCCQVLESERTMQFDRMAVAVIERRRLLGEVRRDLDRRVLFMTTVLKQYLCHPSTCLAQRLQQSMGSLSGGVGSTKTADASVSDDEFNALLFYITFYTAYFLKYCYHHDMETTHLLFPSSPSEESHAAVGHGVRRHPFQVESMGPIEFHLMGSRSTVVVVPAAKLLDRTAALMLGAVVAPAADNEFTIVNSPTATSTVATLTSVSAATPAATPAATVDATVDATVPATTTTPPATTRVPAEAGNSGDANRIHSHSQSSGGRTQHQHHQYQQSFLPPTAPSTSGSAGLSPSIRAPLAMAKPHSPDVASILEEFEATFASMPFAEKLPLFLLKQKQKQSSRTRKAFGDKRQVVTVRRILSGMVHGRTTEYSDLVFSSRLLSMLDSMLNSSVIASVAMANAIAGTVMDPKEQFVLVRRARIGRLQPGPAAIRRSQSQSQSQREGGEGRQEDREAEEEAEDEAEEIDGRAASGPGPEGEKEEGEEQQQKQQELQEEHNGDDDDDEGDDEDDDDDDEERKRREALMNTLEQWDRVAPL